MDADAPSLGDYLGKEAKAHIDAWKLENRYIYLHVAKRLPCNWKLAVDAFLEAYHVIETHPQVAPSNGDANTQYDIYGEHVNRFISPLGVVSPHLYGKYSEQDVLNQRSEEHTSELQSLMRISYAVFCLKKKKNKSQLT